MVPGLGDGSSVWIGIYMAKESGNIGMEVSVSDSVGSA